MNAFVTHIQGLFGEATAAALVLVALAAVLAIIVFVLLGVFSGTDQGRSMTVKRIVTVLLICAVAAFATPLVNWVMA